MSKNADGFITDSLNHIANANHAPAAGTTCVASVSTNSGHEKLHLTSLGWSIRNVTAAAFTATLSVRDGSIAGTVLATWDILCAANAGQLDNFATHIMASKGNPIVAEFGTPAASVTQKVSIGVWRNQSND